MDANRKVKESAECQQRITTVETDRDYIRAVLIKRAQEAETRALTAETALRDAHHLFAEQTADLQRKLTALEESAADAERRAESALADAKGNVEARATDVCARPASPSLIVFACHVSSKKPCLVAMAAALMLNFDGLVHVDVVAGAALPHMLFDAQASTADSRRFTLTLSDDADSTAVLLNMRALFVCLLIASSLKLHTTIHRSVLDRLAAVGRAVQVTGADKLLRATRSHERFVAACTNAPARSRILAHAAILHSNALKISDTDAAFQRAADMLALHFSRPDALAQPDKKRARAEESAAYDDVAAPPAKASNWSTVLLCRRYKIVQLNAISFVLFDFDGCDANLGARIVQSAHTRATLGAAAMRGGAHAGEAELGRRGATSRACLVAHLPRVQQLGDLLRHVETDGLAVRVVATTAADEGPWDTARATLGTAVQCGAHSAHGNEIALLAARVPTVDEGEGAQRRPCPPAAKCH